MDRLKEYRAEQIADEAEKRLSMINEVRTCHNISDSGVFKCSQCLYIDFGFGIPNYCRFCGAKVVYE